MRISSYRDVKAGDTVHASTGQWPIVRAAHYVAWVSLVMERPDGTYWEGTMHDGNAVLWHVTRDSTS